MLKKYREVKITSKGSLTDEKGKPIMCPVRGKCCRSTCAWFSAEGRIVRCQHRDIGAIRGAPVRSFRLSFGPQVYEQDNHLPLKVEKQSSLVKDSWFNQSCSHLISKAISGR